MNQRNLIEGAEDVAGPTAGDGRQLVLEDFLAYRIRRLADAFSLEFSRVYRDRYGLSRPEWRTLATLGQFGTSTATAIGQHSAMHKTKVSRAVAELEKRRWLTRTSDALDRRVEHLALTRQGLDVYRELVPLARAFEADFLTHMSEADRGALFQALGAMESALGVVTQDGQSKARRDPSDSRRTL